MKAKERIITVKDQEIRVIRKQGQDFISVTDMMKSADDGFFLANWLRNRNTIEFLGVWEKVNNPVFNCVEFGGLSR